MRLTSLLLTHSLLFCAIAAADPCTSSANLISNCGFETGTFSSWTLSGVQSSPAYDGVSHGVDAAGAYSGNYGAYVGGFGGYLSVSQSFATIPNTLYVVSYYLAHSPATPSPYVSGFSAFFNGSTLFAASNAPDLPYTDYRFSTAATSSVSTLTLSARDDTGFFSLDNISVVAVVTPEPATFGVMLSSLFIVSMIGLGSRAM